MDSKHLDKAPEVLSRFAQDLFDSDEGHSPLEKKQECHQQKHGSKQNFKLQLAKVGFLFEMAQTEEETNSAVKAAINWAKLAMECCESRDRENSSFEIGCALNNLAITASLHNLPRDCSCKLDFPLILPPTKIPFSALPNRVRVLTAARMDIAGGWTDTPPITYELSSPHVLNAAIKVDGEKPIRADAYPLEHLSGLWISTGEGTLRCFETKDEIIENAQKPAESCSLICAVVVASGVLETLGSKKSKDTEDASSPNKKLLQFDAGGIRFGGLYIRCHSNLPHGSGLGTSSILSGAVLASLWTLFCRKFNENDIIKAVLKVEQYHTTQGGWQDQVGGLIPGIKIGSLTPSPHQSVTYRILPLSAAFEHSLNQRLLLIYTGKTRLAKNLLQTVLLNWIRGDLDIMLAFRTLASDAEKAGKQIAAGIFPTEIARNYHEIKKKLALGSEPVFVGDLIQDLIASNLIELAWIAGAGGGGFLYVFLKEGVTKEDLEMLITSQPQYQSLKVSSVEIDNNPMEIIVT